MLNRLPQPIPYQGSKRNIATQILRYAPRSIERIIEPFAGSAAVSVAAAYRDLERVMNFEEVTREQ
jgi:DNA adenine methylase